MVNPVVKKVLHLLFGEYSEFYIFRVELPGTVVADDDTAGSVSKLDKSVILQNRGSFGAELTHWYAPGVLAYGYFHGSRLAGICAYVDCEHNPQADSWSLKRGEAMLVQIVTLPEMRKHGVARALIRRSAALMAGEGFTRAYARVWHSNVPSLRAFASAGWERIAVVLEVNPLRRKSAFRIRVGSR